MQRLANAGNKVVLEADIHKFFDEVDRSILFPSFIREVRRPSLNELLKSALEMEVGNLDEFSDQEKQLFPAADSGIPQGGVLSPMLANYYLYKFDKRMSDAGFNLVRYADDFVVMCKDEHEARAAYALAKQILEKQLHLRLHALGAKDSKTRIVQFDLGLKFLGIMFRAGTITPSGAVIKKFKLRIDEILSPRQADSLLSTLTSLKNTIIGWGQCYRDFDVSQLYPELIFIFECVPQNTSAIIIFCCAELMSPESRFVCWEFPSFASSSPNRNQLQSPQSRLTSVAVPALEDLLRPSSIGP